MKTQKENIINYNTFFLCFHNYVSKNALLYILSNIFIIFFLCFHNYVSKNALLEMGYFLIFGHIYIFFSFFFSF